jgi:hypothetical protein
MASLSGCFGPITRLHISTPFMANTKHWLKYELPKSSEALPLGAHSLVSQWISLHRAELLEKWELARQFKPLGKVDPLP